MILPLFLYVTLKQNFNAENSFPLDPGGGISLLASMQPAPTVRLAYLSPRHFR
jgi:hypothetical protein